MICLVEAQVETLKIIFKLYGSHFTISYLIWIIGLGMENIYKHWKNIEGTLKKGATLKSKTRYQ